MDPNLQLLTASQLQCSLLVNIAEKQAALHAEIEQHNAEAQRLRRVANEHSEWQQTTAAQHTMKEASQHLAAIDVAKLAIRRLDEEREGIVRGTDPRLATAIHNGATEALSEQQQEYRDALAAFQELNTPELKAAAQRLVQATRAMGVGWEPSTLAKAIAGEHLHPALAL